MSVFKRKDGSAVVLGEDGRFVTNIPSVSSAPTSLPARPVLSVPPTVDSTGEQSGSEVMALFVRFATKQDAHARRETLVKNVPPAPTGYADVTGHGALHSLWRMLPTVTPDL